MKKILFLLAIAASLTGRTTFAVPSGTFYTVTGTLDNTDSTSHGGTGASGNPLQMSSLRGAILAVNAANASSAATITLPVGTYTLTIAGQDDTASAGDLDVLVPLIIQGAGAATTIIQAGTTSANGIDKVFSFNPGGALNGFPITLSGLTIQNGKNSSTDNNGDGEAGAFDFDAGPNGAGSLTITSCVISNNSTINGDGGALALFDGGTISITGSTIVSNTAVSLAGTSVVGGGIFVGSSGKPSTLTISGCTISGNKVLTGPAPQGGGLFMFGPFGTGTATNSIHNSTISNNQAGSDGGGIYTTAALGIDQASILSGNVSGGDGGGLWNNAHSSVTLSTLTGNSATGNGGGVHNDTSGAALAVLNCRLAGNTAGTGSALGNATGGGTVTAAENWWGNNTPAPQISGTVGFTPYLTLGTTFNPTAVLITNSSLLTASLLLDSAGGSVSLPSLATLINLPITFNTPVLGAISGASTSIPAAAIATATFNAGAVSGSGSIRVTLDSLVTNVPIAVLCPTITGTIGTNGSICAGNSTNVTVTVSGGAQPYTVVLGGGGGFQTLTGAGPSFTFTVSPSGTAVYSATGTDVHGCSATITGTATITVVPPPSATITATSPVCGGSANTASGPAGLAGYAWSIDSGGTLTSDPSLPTVSYTAGASGTLTLTLVTTNATGCTATNSAPVTINAVPAAPAITAAGSVCAGSTDNSASGPAGASSYTWSIAGGTLTGASTQQFISYTAGASGSVVLGLQVSNGSGCTAANSASVTINPLPATPDITAADSVCENSMGNTATGPDGATGYFWTITNGTITDGTNSQTVTYTAGDLTDGDTVDLTLVVSNALGCEVLNATNITLNPTPTIPLISISPSGGIVSLPHNRPRFIIIPFNPPVCADSSGNTASVADSYSSYAWTINNGTITSDPTTNSVSFTAGDSGSVTLTVVVGNDSGCTVTNSTSVTINPQAPAPAITAAASVCELSTGNTATGPDGASSYAWSISNGIITSDANSQTVTYEAGTVADGATVNLTLTVGNGTGCNGTGGTNITLNPMPSTPAIIAVDSLCENAAGTASGPDGAGSYSWSISNGIITGATNTQTVTYISGDLGDGATVDLTLTVGNDSGCTASSTTNITLNAAPDAPEIILIPRAPDVSSPRAHPLVRVIRSVCTGSTGNQAEGPAASSYAWTISNGSITSDPSQQTITFTAGGSGTLTLTLVVANDSGCSATNSLDVNIDVPPAPVIVASDHVCADTGGNSATGPDGASQYSWGISNGSISGAADGQTISYVAGDSGQVTLSLTVTTASGCSASSSTNINIGPTAAPVFAGCPGNIVVSTDPGSCSAIVDWTSILDQQNNSADSVAVGRDQWQSFTAGVSGPLSGITINFAEPQNDLLNLIVYDGTGTGGSVIYLASLVLDSSGPTNLTIDSGPTLTAGGTYTFRLETTSSFSLVAATNGYPAGSYASDIPGYDPALALQFATHVGQSVTAADACGNVKVDGNIEPGTTFPTGVTTIIYTASNSVGTSTCSFTVTVNDTNPPAISCPADIVLWRDDTIAADPVSFIVQASDNCTVTNLTSTPASGSDFPFGITTVNSTATDASGNSASCSFTVTIYTNLFAGDFEVETAEGLPLDLAVTNIMQYAFDPNGFPLTFAGTSATSTNGGTLVLNGAGDTVTYTPVNGFHGRDEFSYTVTDDHGGSAQGDIIVVVIPPRPPFNQLLIYNDGGAYIQYTGTPGDKYIFQSATKVAGPYRNLSPVLTADPFGVISFTDTLAPAPSARFYRVVSAP